MSWDDPRARQLVNLEDAQKDESMVNLKMIGQTYHSIAAVNSDGKDAARISINPESVWTPAELRKVAALLESAARMIEA